MADLVTLADAKLHLHVVGNDRDADIALKVSEASETIIDYLKSDESEDWTDADAPGPIKAATLILLGNLYENRGDDMAKDESAWAAIERYCRRFRDPALA